MIRTGLALLVIATLFPSTLIGQQQTQRGRTPVRPDGATPPEESRQFDFLLGQWGFDGVWKNPEGDRAGIGTWSARKAFDGFAVVDEWRVLNPTTRVTMVLGASTRMYDAETGQWELIYHDVFNSAHERQYARWENGEMSVWWEGAEPGGRAFIMRARYTAIEIDSFEWEGDRSYDGGATWIEGWLRLKATRLQAGSG